MNIERKLRRADREPALIRSTELYAVLAREILAPEGTCRAFAIHPDRTAVLVDLHGRVCTLRPAADGLYDLGPLGGGDASGPLLVHRDTVPAGRASGGR